MGSLLQLFPMDRRSFWQQIVKEERYIQEIRLRAGQPVLIIKSGREYFLTKSGEFTDKQQEGYVAEKEEVEAILQHICHYSLYAFEDELRQGFITTVGGHRVGLAGQVVMEGEKKVRTIKHISYINIRVAHQMKGAADKILPYLYQKGRLKNILIISPPGCGKTTLLRDMIRQVSNGNCYGKGMCVGVVDERSEIAGSYLGMAQNDLGMRTDILDACPKALGMMMLLRSMSPQVVAVDELGCQADIKALQAAAACGSRILATIHGENLQDADRKFYTYCTEEYHAFAENYSLMCSLFDMFLILGKENGIPVIQKVYGKEEANVAIMRGNHDCKRMFWIGDMVSEQVSSEDSNIKKIAVYSGNDDK